MTYYVTLHNCLNELPDVRELFFLLQLLYLLLALCGILAQRAGLPNVQGSGTNTRF